MAHDIAGRMKLLIDETLPLIDELFNGPLFQTNFFNKTSEQLTCDVDVVICRAHTKINQAFFNGHQAKIIATATSGSDHIDKIWLEKNNVTWIDAIGCNARSVSDYVLHLLFHPKLYLTGKKIGIVGVGQVGSILNLTLQSLEFETVCYDPPKAKQDPLFKSANINELFSCDVISLHLPLSQTGMHKTINIIDEDFLKKCKKDAVIINTSRGEVLNEKAMLNSTHLRFCIDVYRNEPHINPEIVRKAFFATPHIAGHAIEAKLRAMVLTHKKLFDFFDIKYEQHAYSYLLNTQSNLPALPLNFSYDPMLETLELNEMPNQATFLQLRQQHNSRHELS